MYWCAQVAKKVSAALTEQKSEAVKGKKRQKGRTAEGENDIRAVQKCMPPPIPLDGSGRSNAHSGI